MILERKIRKYSEKLFKEYPRFNKYLKTNNKISSLIMDIYDSNILPEPLDFEIEFSTKDSILLAQEIIASICPKLKDVFLEKLKSGSIEFVIDQYSCTMVKDNKVYSQVLKCNNICDAIVLVHEFFHNYHLEMYDNNLKNEDFYFFTEMFGMLADIYASYYLIYTKKEYIEESKNYLSLLMNAIFNCSDYNLIHGTILDIYSEKKSLSKNSIASYVKENNLPSGYLDILYTGIGDDVTYTDSSIYIFNFPLAFKLAFNLLCEDGYKEKFVDIFYNLNKYTPEQYLAELGINNHINNYEELLDTMNNIYFNLKDVYNDNKVKKKGEL